MFRPFVRVVAASAAFLVATAAWADGINYVELMVAKVQPASGPVTYAGELTVYVPGVAGVTSVQLDFDGDGPQDAFDLTYYGDGEYGAEGMEATLAELMQDLGPTIHLTVNTSGGSSVYAFGFVNSNVTEERFLPTVQITSPADGAVTGSEPTFQWNRSFGVPAGAALLITDHDSDVEDNSIAGLGGLSADQTQWTSPALAAGEHNFTIGYAQIFTDAAGPLVKVSGMDIAWGNAPYMAGGDVAVVATVQASAASWNIQVVPEPATLGILVLGAVGLWRRTGKRN